MKRLMLVLACVCLCFCAFALDAQDVEFLKSLDSFKGTCLAGQYSQIKGVSGSSRTLTTTGSVLISPDDGIAWIAEKPYASILVVSKDHLTQKIRNNSPSRLDVSGNEIYTSIATALECVFFGDFDTMLNVFDATLSVGDKWSLVLVPKTKSMASFIKNIEIVGSSSIESLCMYEPTGDKIVYNFTNLISRELSGEEKAVYSL